MSQLESSEPPHHDTVLVVGNDQPKSSWLMVIFGAPCSALRLSWYITAFVFFAMVLRYVLERSAPPKDDREAAMTLYRQIATGGGSINNNPHRVISW